MEKLMHIWKCDLLRVTSWY